MNALAQASLAGAYARVDRHAEASIALADLVGMRKREFAAGHLPPPNVAVAGLAGGFRAMWRRQQDRDHIA